MKITFMTWEIQQEHCMPLQGRVNGGVGAPYQLSWKSGTVQKVKVGRAVVPHLVSLSCETVTWDSV